jgi:hypothetical protein
MIRLSPSGTLCGVGAGAHPREEMGMVETDGLSHIHLTVRDLGRPQERATP